MQKKSHMTDLIRHLYERGFSFLAFLLVLLSFAISGTIPEEMRPSSARSLTETKGNTTQTSPWRAEGTEWLSRKSTEVTRRLRASGIQNVTVYNRMKSEESAREKAQKRGIDVTELKDLYGMRVVVGNELDVYQCLNTICNTYEVVPGTMKNYIVAPKASGYQSIHVVTKIESRMVEFQIRTESMHLSAEAEHEAYKARMRAA